MNFKSGLKEILEAGLFVLGIALAGTVVLVVYVVIVTTVYTAGVYFLG
jgi:hypothetical protein